MLLIGNKLCTVISILIFVSMSVIDNKANLVLIYILLVSFESLLSVIRFLFISSFSICSKYILNPIFDTLLGTMDISISPSLVKKLLTILPYGSTIVPSKLFFVIIEFIASLYLKYTDEYDFTISGLLL